MFVCRTYIEFNSFLLYDLLYVLKLPVCQYCLYFEPAHLVCLYYLFNGCYECIFFMSFISSAVPKCILRDVVITKGILLMNIISIASTTSPCLSIISHGMSCGWICTCFCLVCVVFPFIDPMLGPNMSSALMMSCFVTGQLGIRFLSSN